MKKITILLIISTSALFAQSPWRHRVSFGAGGGMPNGAFRTGMGYFLTAQGEAQYELRRGNAGLVAGIHGDLSLADWLIDSTRYVEANQIFLTIPSCWLGVSSRFPLRIKGDTVALRVVAGAAFSRNEATVSRSYTYLDGYQPGTGYSPATVTQQVQGISPGWVLGIAEEVPTGAKRHFYYALKAQYNPWHTTQAGSWYIANPSYYGSPRFSQQADTYFHRIAFTFTLGFSYGS